MMMMKHPVPDRLHSGRWSLLLAVWAGMIGQRSAWSAATSTTPEGLVITADRMELDDKKQTAVFYGSVRAEEKRIQLTSDKMTVSYQKNNRRQPLPAGSNRGGVMRIQAEGHVVLVQETSQGTADEMIYLVDKQLLEMNGQVQNAAIIHGKDRLEGRKILLTIGEDHTISKINVLSGDQRRVSARITPSENGEGAGTAPGGAATGKPGKGGSNRSTGQ
jgi:lipopolysaccharide transport protein LptA